MEGNKSFSKLDVDLYTLFFTESTFDIRHLTAFRLVVSQKESVLGSQRLSTLQLEVKILALPASKGWILTLKQTRGK